MREELLCLVISAFIASAAIAVRADTPVAQTMRIDSIPFKLNLDPEFEFRDDVLTLKEYCDNAAGAARFQTLWTGPLAEDPQHFLLATTESEAILEDAAGKSLWTEHFEQPSLTLTLNKTAGTALLTDQEGRTLWNGSWDGTLTGRGSSPSHVSVDGFEFSFVKDRPASLANAAGDVLWSGSHPLHGGLVLVENRIRSVVNFHALPYPANAKFFFEIANVPETATLEDSRHAVLATGTTATVQIVKRYSTGYYADHPIISRVRPSIMPRPLTDGRFTVLFQDGAGQTTLLQTIDITSAHTVVLPGGRELETGQYHRTAQDKQGRIVEDISSTTTDDGD